MPVQSQNKWHVHHTFFHHAEYVERLKKNITVKECNRECEVGSTQCVVCQTLDKLVRSLLRSEGPYGNCANCRHDSTVQGPVGEHELQLAWRIGLHNTYAGYQLSCGGAVRRVLYLRNICKNGEGKVSFLCVFAD